MKKLFAPLFKNSLVTLLVVAVMLTGGIIAFGRGGSSPSKARQLAVFSQDTGNARQVIIVRSPSASPGSASLEAQEFDGTSWKTIVGPINAKIGKNGFSPAARDGDGTTPQGVFTIGKAFGRAKSVSGVRIGYDKIDANSWWVSDPDSPDYNTWAIGPSQGRWRDAYGQHLLDKKFDKAYKLAVIIDANPFPVNHERASATFLHVADGEPTVGGVGINETDLTKIVRWLDPKLFPRIVMGTDAWLLDPVEAPSVLGAEPVGLVMVEPTRIVETRTGAASSEIGPGAIIRVPISGLAGVPSNATVVAINVTIDKPRVTTFLTVAPTGPGPMPNTSNLNVHAGETRAALVLARIGTDGAIRIRNEAGSAQLIVDVVGYGTTSSRDGYRPDKPHRVLDTKIGFGMDGTRAEAMSPNTILDFPVGPIPTGATAVVMNLTATDATTPTFITAFAGGTNRPETSNLNIGPDRTVSNVVIVPINATNVVRLYNAVGEVHVRADIFGFIVAGSGNLYVPALQPTRVLDTRSGITHRTQIAPKDDLSLSIPGLPSTATALAINITGVNASGPTQLQVVPSGEATTTAGPVVNNVDVVKQEATGNAAIAQLGAKDQRITIKTNTANTDVIVDVSGWFVSRP